MHVNVPSNPKALMVAIPDPVLYDAASNRVNCGTSCVKRPPVATKSESPGTIMPWLISAARP